MVYRLVDSLEIFDKARAVFVADITQRVPDLMHYALLHVAWLIPVRLSAEILDVA